MKVTQSGVLLTNDVIVDFFKSNASESIALAFEQNAVSFVTLVKEAISRHTSESQKEREVQEVRQLLTLFEEQQKTLLDSFVDNVGQRFRTATEGIVDKVDERLNNVAKQIEVNVTSVMSHLNTQSLITSISDVVRSWMETTTKQSSTDVKLALSDFQSQLSTHIHNNITTPLETIKSQVLEQVPSVIDNKVRDGFFVLEKEISHLRNGLQSNHLDALVQKALDKVSETGGELHALNSSIPHMVKDTIVSALRRVEQQVSDVHAVVDNKMHERLLMVQSQVSDAALAARRSVTETEELNNKLEKIEKELIIKNTKSANSSSKARGVLGETLVLDRLAETLMERDGYTIETTAGIAHACDFLIKRRGYPEVRIDSKAYDSQEKVRTKEVKKFRSDLLQQGSHGIMVSLYSGIVGKSKVIDIEQLSNGKLAVYLSNTGPTIEIVEDALAIIYRLDSLLSQKESDNNFQISPESINKIKELLTEFAERTLSVKQKLKESMSILTEMHDSLLGTLLQTLSSSDTLVGGNAYACECGYSSKSGPGLSSHKKKCKKSSN
jgi:hypothetical protein